MSYTAIHVPDIKLIKNHIVNIYAIEVNAFFAAFLFLIPAKFAYSIGAFLLSDIILLQQ